MKSEKRIRNILVTTGIVVFIIMLTIPCYCPAGSTEEQLKSWPSPCYQGDDLAKVREWEKAWSGKKLTRITLMTS